MTTARETRENCTQKFKFESETEPEKLKLEMNNKRVKILGGILILVLLLLNFVLVVVVMNRTSESEILSSSSTSDFSAAVNQTHKTGQIVKKMKFELDGIEKWKNSTEEKFESHKIQIQALSNQTKIDKEIETLENQNREFKKSHKELKEQFETLSQKLARIKVNILLGQNVSLQTPPASTTRSTKHEDQERIDPQTLPNCREAMEIFPSPRSKRQIIHPHGNSTSLEVVCDFETEGGGWTIIQKRSSGPKEEFQRNWNEYENGFGSLEKNFWIGLENIRALTKNGDQELRIDLEDFEGNKKYAKYSNFSVSDASDFYRLTIDGFSGDATDSMANPNSGSFNMLNGMRFSTKDKDNDKWNGDSCAKEYGGGGWWLNDCGWSNLNGLYYEKGETVSEYDGILWHSWNSNYHSLAKSEMKIRTRKS